MPACQTSAGCVCGRTPYTPPFSPTVADTYWANEVKTLNEQIDRLTRELAEAQKDRDYWKVEAEGERAKVAYRDKQLERYRLTNTEENNLNILAHEIDAAARALKEKP